jgi:hypothetical protein
MGRAADAWRREHDRTGPTVATGGDPEGLPEITDLLVGKVQGGGAKWERLPYKLLLWLEGSEVKFCFTYRGCKEKCWGTAPTLKEGLLGVEAALCKGNFAWKQAEEDGNGLTYHRK